MEMEVEMEIKMKRKWRENIKKLERKQKKK